MLLQKLQKVVQIPILLSLVRKWAWQTDTQTHAHHQIWGSSTQKALRATRLHPHCSLKEQWERVVPKNNSWSGRQLPTLQKICDSYLSIANWQTNFWTSQKLQNVSICINSLPERSVHFLDCSKAWFKSPRDHNTQKIIKIIKISKNGYFWSTSISETKSETPNFSTQKISISER